MFLTRITMAITLLAIRESIAMDQSESPFDVHAPATESSHLPENINPAIRYTQPKFADYITSHALTDSLTSSEKFKELVAIRRELYPSPPRSRPSGPPKIVIVNIKNRDIHANPQVHNHVVQQGAFQYAALLPIEVRVFLGLGLVLIPSSWAAEKIVQFMSAAAYSGFKWCVYSAKDVAVSATGSILGNVTNYR